MEILIIFIIMMVLSTVLRSLRGPKGRTSAPPAPPRPRRPVPPDVPDFPEERIVEPPDYGLDFLEWAGYEQKLETPAKDDFEKQKIEHVFVPKEPRRAVQPKKAVPSRAISSPQKKEIDMEGGLQELLSGEKLPLAIVAAEIFSAPRAKRQPFERKI
ncbi:MAG: hypothetical protein GX996_03430 [Firmicutes bacterium]|nr:hypothetical protein [Bacillota bacterium]